jgi:N-sulfoglucosamine sulfohydrolase
MDGASARSTPNSFTIWSSTPNETRNAAGDPSAKAALEEMRGWLHRWMQATNDPILRGPIPAPPGAIANDPEGTSPNEPAKVAG